MTDPFDSAAAAGHQLQAQVTALQSALAAETAREQADQATIASLQAQLAAVDAPATLWGKDASSAAQHSLDAPLYDPVGAWRYYHQAGEWGYPTEYALADGEHFVLSTKVLPQNLTLAQLVSLFSAAPAGRDFVYCPWHEPEDDVAAGSFTAAQLRAAYALVRQAATQVGPHIKVAVILMGYTWQAVSGRNPETYIPADADFDYLLTDTYFAGTIGQPVSAIPTAFDAQLATAAAHGKAWGIGECGIGQKVTGQARLDAVTSLAATIKAKGGAFGLYFATGTTSQWWLDSAGVAAWKAGQQ